MSDSDIGIPPPSVCTAVFQQYFLEERLAEIEELLLKRDPLLHYSVYVNMLDILNLSTEVGEALLSHPLQILPYSDQALQLSVAHVFGNSFDRERMLLKGLVHSRVHSLPPFPDFTKSSVSSIRSSDQGRLVTLIGTVIRTGAVKSTEGARIFTCTMCKGVFTVRKSLQEASFVPPSICGASKPRGGVCQGTKFMDSETMAYNRDYQEIKLQDQVTRLSMGSIPRSLIVVLADDLVDQVKPGDDVAVTGVLFYRWQGLREQSRCDISLVMEALSLRMANNRVQLADDESNEGACGTLLLEDMAVDFVEYWKKWEKRPLIGREIILRSICPQIYGLSLVKTALILTLIGGVPYESTAEEGGTRVRGECHLLLVGDPGTGKSQFLNYASSLSSRSVITTGVGTTSAGLTVTAVRDGPEWGLEAGALVLADGGVCCIDEFSAVREHDRASIHEAMEQQTISVAKAGLICTLNTRTTIIAACNPKAKFELHESLSENIRVPPPLLSRFDLILVLLDRANPTWDENVADFILAGGDTSNPGTQASESSAGSSEKEKEKEKVSGSSSTNTSHHQDNVAEPVAVDRTLESQMWSTDELTSYIAYVKAAFKPKFTPVADDIITTYYQHQRQRSSFQDTGRITIRLLESLIRLSQAHARMMFRSEVYMMDALFAVYLVDTSLSLDEVGGLDAARVSMFPDDPFQFYGDLQNRLLTKLNLQKSSFPNSDPTDFRNMLREGNPGGLTPLSVAVGSKKLANLANLIHSSPRADDVSKRKRNDDISSTYPSSSDALLSLLDHDDSTRT
jgi:DNA helicase MCM9